MTKKFLVFICLLFSLAVINTALSFPCKQGKNIKAGDLKMRTFDQQKKIFCVGDLKMRVRDESRKNPMQLIYHPNVYPVKESKIYIFVKVTINKKTYIFKVDQENFKRSLNKTHRGDCR